MLDYLNEIFHSNLNIILLEIKIEIFHLITYAPMVRQTYLEPTFNLNNATHLQRMQVSSSNGKDIECIRQNAY